mmetsp:Transcript_49341/g.86901  ORF Transcript_49341/g.86901 Transcript_49341/m.86901 type:complete len:251 (-) Transcript_49341:199-951(-)
MDSSSQRKDALAYNLLLKKMGKESLRGKLPLAGQHTEEEASSANMSTAEPGSSSAASSIGMDAENASQPDVLTGTSSLCDGLENVTAPAKANLTILRNISVNDARMTALLSQLRNLSEKVFDEDCLSEITKKSGWKLTVLASDDLCILCGFLVAKVVNGTLSIAKLAVPVEFRGNGFGKLIMEETMKLYKKQGNVYEVCLSSLPTAVSFYQCLGFKAFKGWSKANMERLAERNLVQGQVYMEKKLCSRRR